MLVRPTNRPGNEATLDASWRIRDAYQVTSYASAACVSRGYMACARARVAWLHGLRACRMLTWFARVAWLHGLPNPSPSPTACGRIRELQRSSVSSNYIK